MGTFKVRAVLFGLFITVLLSGLLSFLFAGLSVQAGQPVPVALAAPKRTVAPPDTAPTPTPTSAIVAPVGINDGVLEEPPVKPTRRFPRGNDFKITPGPIAPPCENRADGQPLVQTNAIAGAPFQVVVIMVNTGSCDWGPGYGFAFLGKEAMGADSVVNLTSTVPPNAGRGFAINMVAPNSPGYHVGYWQMKGSDGRLFGTPVEIVVFVTQ